jgi:hypothetical protein
MPNESARQFTFRLPETLVKRVDDCLERIRSSGLSVNRTDIVRMLITRALDTIHCDPEELFDAASPPRSRS